MPLSASQPCKSITKGTTRRELAEALRRLAEKLNRRPNPMLPPGTGYGALQLENT